MVAAAVVVAVGGIWVVFFHHLHWCKVAPVDGDLDWQHGLRLYRIKRVDLWRCRPIVKSEVEWRLRPHWLGRISVDGEAQQDRANRGRVVADLNQAIGLCVGVIRRHERRGAAHESLVHKGCGDLSTRGAEAASQPGHRPRRCKVGAVEAEDMGRAKVGKGADSRDELWLHRCKHRAEVGAEECKMDGGVTPVAELVA